MLHPWCRSLLSEMSVQPALADLEGFWSDVSVALVVALLLGALLQRASGRARVAVAGCVAALWAAVAAAPRSGPGARRALPPGFRANLAGDASGKLVVRVYWAAPPLVVHVAHDFAADSPKRRRRSSSAWSPCATSSRRSRSSERYFSATAAKGWRCCARVGPSPKPGVCGPSAPKRGWPEWRRIPVPAGAARDSGQLLVSFEVKQPGNPRPLGMSEDARELGVALRRLRLSAAGSIEPATR